MNEWENVDSAMNEWKALYRGYEKSRTILFPYLFVNFLNKDTLNLLKVMNIWTRSHVKYKNNGLLRMLCTQKRFTQIWNLRKIKIHIAQYLHVDFASQVLEISWKGRT